MEATDIFDRHEYPVIDNGDGRILVTGKFPEQIVFDSVLYKFTEDYSIKEGFGPLNLKKTKKSIVYTVFSPTDCHLQLIQFQTDEETYEKKPAFVSKMMKETFKGEEYDAINCFFYGEVSYRIHPMIRFKGKKLIYVKCIGENGHQFFFPRE